MSKDKVIKFAIIGTISIIGTICICVGLWHITGTSMSKENKAVPIASPALSNNASENQPTPKKENAKPEAKNIQHQPKTHSNTKPEVTNIQPRKTEKETKPEVTNTKTSPTQYRLTKSEIESRELDLTQPKPNTKPEVNHAQINPTQPNQNHNSHEIDWGLTKILNNNPICSISDFRCCIANFIKIWKNGEQINLDDSNIEFIPATKKYVVDISKSSQNIKTAIYLPNLNGGPKEEENLASLLYNISEIRVNSIIFYSSLQYVDKVADLYILSSALSKLRGCHLIKFYCLYKTKSDGKYKSKLSVPKDQIFNQDLKNVKIHLFYKITANTINVFMENIFMPNIKRISSFFIHLCSISPEEIDQMAKLYNLKLENNKYSDNIYKCYPQGNSVQP
ncbi:hypothetical protein NEFER03_0784 [Nematocida sp. LUAm3]|nr:hypothetical protein NEFER03_0784 [Nematocida sp. LUAm3]KAI5175243.1 hypothetical protein NEFER02_1204 [Nematocida sp. LUAm2]KAI5178085.1 hypothetical protein NEFER01_1263 [Nematocida sp. LUAm1]